jgi:hypothetical protein
MAKKYQYPGKADEENLKKLIERAKEITKKSLITFFASIIVSVVLLFLIIVVYFAPALKIAQNVQAYVEMAFVISFGAALFVSAFLIDFVNVFFLRRIFSNFIPYYPRPEEFVFAQCILTATLFDRFPKSDWARAIRSRSMYLSEEFSRFTKYDAFNFRRKVYAKEFGLLGSGETQIARMLMFSEANKKELLTNFAMAFVNDNDPEAFHDLVGLISEIEKYGKLEILSQRIENQLKKWKTIIAIIGGLVVIIATIVGLIFR